MQNAIRTKGIKRQIRILIEFHWKKIYNSIKLMEIFVNIIKHTEDDYHN